MESKKNNWPAPSGPQVAAPMATLDRLEHSELVRRSWPQLLEEMVNEAAGGAGFLAMDDGQSGVIELGWDYSYEDGMQRQILSTGGLSLMEAAVMLSRHGLGIVSDATRGIQHG